MSTIAVCCNWSSLVCTCCIDVKNRFYSYFVFVSISQLIFELNDVLIYF